MCHFCFLQRLKRLVVSKFRRHLAHAVSQEQPKSFLVHYNPFPVVLLQLLLILDPLIHSQDCRSPFFCRSKRQQEPFLAPWFSSRKRQQHFPALCLICYLLFWRSQAFAQVSLPYHSRHPTISAKRLYHSPIETYFSIYWHYRQEIWRLVSSCHQH